MVRVLATSPPRSTAFDLVLLLHVAVVVVVVVVMAAAYGAARSLAGAKVGQPWPPAAVRYFTPGSEIAGRSLYLIPATGLALVGMSHGSFAFSTPFVTIGFVLWIGVVAVAEVLVFATSKELGALVSEHPVATEEGTWRPRVTSLCWGIDAIVLLSLLGVVVMVAQP